MHAIVGFIQSNSIFVVFHIQFSRLHAKAMVFRIFQLAQTWQLAAYRNQQRNPDNKPLIKKLKPHLKRALSMVENVFPKLALKSGTFENYVKGEIDQMDAIVKNDVTWKKLLALFYHMCDYYISTKESR